MRGSRRRASTVWKRAIARWVGRGAGGDRDARNPTALLHKTRFRGVELVERLVDVVTHRLHTMDRVGVELGVERTACRTAGHLEHRVEFVVVRLLGLGIGPGAFPCEL